MTAPALCAAPIQGTRMRITKLDSCGVPVTGAGGLVVTDGFVSVAATQNYEDGTDYQLRNASGAFCVNESGPDQFTRVDLDMQFCVIDPDIVGLITGVPVIVTGAPSTGTGFWVTEGSVTQRFSLEVWQNIAGQACVGSTQRYVYWAWPNLGGGKFNDFTIEDDVLEFTLSAKSKKANTAWGAGPTAANDWTSAVPDGAHYGMNIAALTLPAVTGCGATTLT